MTRAITDAELKTQHMCGANLTVTLDSYLDHDQGQFATVRRRA
jgi:hypothetical protein